MEDVFAWLVVAFFMVAGLLSAAGVVGAVIGTVIAVARAIGGL